MSYTNSENVLVGLYGEAYPASHDANQATNIKAEEVSDAKEDADPVRITVQEMKAEPENYTNSENVSAGPHGEVYPASRDADQAMNVKAEEVSDVEEEEVPVLITFPGIKAEPEMESVTILPASVEFDNMISTSCTSEITSTNADACKTEVEPFTNDVEVLASTEDHTAVNVMVVKPFVVEMTSGTQLSDGKPAHLEVERQCNQFSSSLKLLGKPNQQFKRGTKTNVRKGLEGKKGEHSPKVRQSNKELQAHTSLESKVSQDGPMLKFTISRTKPASSMEVSSSQKLSLREKIPSLEELLLPKQTRGCPPKRVYPSASKEKSNPDSRSWRRKSSSSVADESWTPSSKKSKMSSVDPVRDRYQELRDKNNEASRKSRQNRKARENEMKERVAELERENQSLNIKVDEQEQLLKKLREALLEAVIENEEVLMATHDS